VVLGTAVRDSCREVVAAPMEGRDTRCDMAGRNFVGVSGRWAASHEQRPRRKRSGASLRATVCASTDTQSYGHSLVWTLAGEAWLSTPVTRRPINARTGNWSAPICAPAAKVNSGPCTAGTRRRPARWRSASTNTRNGRRLPPPASTSPAKS
jgi:hypothetical protein